MSYAALVRIEDLVLEARTARGTARILRGVDLEIGRGRILGLVGESGSGKSSLALALLRLLPGNTSRIAGRIELDGTELLELDETDMRALRGTRVAMIFQDPMTALNPLFTIGTQLLDVARRREPGLSRREGLARAEAGLRRVAMPDPAFRLGQYPHELSGGMRQRVMIAMALLAQPVLLIADEPTTALDATIEAQIVALIAELRAGLGASVLFVTHQLGLVAELCDDIAVLYGGTVVETGTVADVLGRPRHPYTAALLGCEIQPGASEEAPLATIPGDVPDPTREVEGCVFASRCVHRAEICRLPAPLRQSGPGRASACHRFEEVT